MMRHSEQVRLVKQLCAQIDSGTTVDAGGFKVLSTSTYVDPQLAERERREFFLAGPQCVGFSGDLPEPGSFLTHDDLGVPILATRDRDGSFRAFVNSCRHRGVIVETADRGTARRFTCPFHAWSYDTSGALVGLPRPDLFGEVDTSCLGLRPLPAEERHGLLFVHPDPDGAIDLDALFGEWFDDELSTWGFDRMLPLTRDAYHVECNWKLAMDTFGETYHFSALHRTTLFNGFHGNVQLHDQDAHLHRMILCRRNIDTMRLLPEDEWDITVAGLPVYWIFPNVILMPFDAGAFLVRAYPDRADPGRHMSRVDFYVKPELVAAEGADAIRAFMADLAHTFANIIRDEDYVAAASQQAAARSGAMWQVVFGRNEPTLHHYHDTYRRKLGLDPLALLDEAEVSATLR
jgi:phenylpropionate dioxygenase-like ring-hydroxylating dioxygenase large terminal subunit